MTEADNIIRLLQTHYFIKRFSEFSFSVMGNNPKELINLPSVAKKLTGAEIVIDKQYSIEFVHIAVYTIHSLIS